MMHDSYNLVRCLLTDQGPTLDRCNVPRVVAFQVLHKSEIMNLYRIESKKTSFLNATTMASPESKIFNSLKDLQDLQVML